MSRLTRRHLLKGALAGALVGCSSERPRTGFLGTMERWNSGFQRWMQSDGRELPRFPDEALTPAGQFPVYHASPFPPPPPAGWALAIGGRRRRKR